MKVVGPKALAKGRGLQGYSRLKKAELITFLRNNLPASRPCPRHPTRSPLSPPSQSVRFRPDMPRQPSLQDMDIFKQQEMSKSRSQVKNKLKDWYDWLVNHVPNSIKDNVSRAFNTFKDKIMGLYKKVKGEKEPDKEESFNPIEREQAFGRAYTSYTFNGRSRMDVDTFFDWIRQNLIDLMNRELTDFGSARVQTTAWIRFRQALEDDFGNVIGFDRAELPFNSRITDIYQGSNLNEIVNEMFAHMNTQIENPALANSRFVFDEVLLQDVSFYHLNLTRGSTFLCQIG